MSDTADIAAWFTGRLPQDWFETAPAVSVDREEIVVTGRLPRPTDVPAEGGAAAARRGEAGRIARFREETRGARMRIADEAEALFGRKVAWGAACGESEELFTNLATPVMTGCASRSARCSTRSSTPASPGRGPRPGLVRAPRRTAPAGVDRAAARGLAGVREARAAGPA